MYKKRPSENQSFEKEKLSKKRSRLTIFGEALANNDPTDLFFFIPHDL